ncbi:triacylglycerol lipase [Endozoicomonas gorgoniicola]|uniref:Triacylglycerol lipase n=1 Tax=Endozoicomonas gorgoniicola TaxID=1234144 RepID=A0ABT3MSV4_9GAMM|nr:triacylglycerol lipase [Endozoicomonas gorgoniicola]MCW7552465.1 triacylglycerol lipase [Endozoicomonas gorgoniicola]
MKRNILTLFCVLSFALQVSTSSASSYAKTQYPIVLVHGLFGFDELLWVDYFYKIPSKLSSHGARVYTATVSPANSTEVRGEQLLNYIDEVLAHSGAEKVNLIGHSHGGPTIRYAASVSPDKVASVSSVGGVNWGSSVADLIRKHIKKGTAFEGLAAATVNNLANLIELLSGSGVSKLPTDILAATEALTTEKTIQFNQRYPEGIPSTYCGKDGDMLAGNGVYYFSWSGGSTSTNIFDVSDPFLVATGLVFGEENDGLVSSCSSHLGYVIKSNYRMNHLDEVNQLFGLSHLFETDPVNLFITHANRLKKLGL